MDLNAVYDSLSVVLLVFVRLAGMVLFNPLLSRRNVPSQVRIGFVLVLTLLIYPGVGSLPQMNGLDIVIGMVRELFAGFCCGYVFQLFYYFLFFAGDFMDMQFGLSMAKVFDPGTNIQASVSGTLLSTWFVLYIFATDSHLLLIRIFATSYDIIPVGAFGLSSEALGYSISLFISAFSLVLRLTLPFIATEFTLEMGMGVLMKLIPQIHVFVINIQFKILLALIMFWAYAGPLSSFLDRYMNEMLHSIENALYVLAG
ncbi:MAG: flagellar biosynthetic protein FliR [Provencibacterium sp.]|nr:flagellar biosynthetic protein FliR [Provencibacterium sp.]